MDRRQSGFTLMEMIGVVAVIAILASIATPMIFDTIRNARVTAFVQDVNVLRTAVARYYQHTGQFPVHIPTDTRDGRRLLLKNSTTAPVGGWDGPYLEKEFANPFNPTGYRSVFSTTDANYQFDLDGDGAPDTTRASLIRIDNVGDEEARMISDIVDGDGDEASGNNAWNKAGRVKRYGVNGDHPSIVLIYLTKA